MLLINEWAGSGGDYFPWIFRQLDAGPLIGTRTWGGLVRSSSAFPLIDGGFVTAPENRVFAADGTWIAENEGIAPIGFDPFLFFDPFYCAQRLPIIGTI